MYVLGISVLFPDKNIIIVILVFLPFRKQKEASFVNCRLRTFNNKYSMFLSHLHRNDIIYFYNQKDLRHIWSVMLLAHLNGNNVIYFY
jgi:hypothetical protein